MSILIVFHHCNLLSADRFATSAEPLLHCQQTEPVLLMSLKPIFMTLLHLLESAAVRSSSLLQEPDHDPGRAVSRYHQHGWQEGQSQEEGAGFFAAK